MQDMFFSLLTQARGLGEIKSARMYTEEACFVEAEINGKKYTFSIIEEKEKTNA